MILSACGGCRDWITFCRKGKVQMRKTCCADSVQVGEGRGRCYVKAAALQLGSSKNLLCVFVAWRAVELRLCLFQTWGSDGPSPGWDCSQCKGGVTRWGQTLPGRGLRCHLSVGNKKTKMLGTHCGVRVALARPFPGGGFGGCAGPSLALAPVIWVPSGCTLIIPQARLLQVCSFTPLRLGH